MKIKKLSMVGFKSFMDRLDVVFPPGVSGVVGPNGCGKSNIVDAIRWCMGEQSPKQLRGRKMEDIIFSGAGDNKPLGMAEVSMLLENGDGSFPPAFEQSSQLSVTRRLYRSGESEYLINNMPCRLKDIQDIFMDTGLGNRAYSIISQGQIGTIIEQRPEETRVMLEEAAGITKYRKKVEASQRKIESTEANLQRVEDIQGEVEKQMRSLKRQAAKARRYKKVCDEIKELELTLYANAYHQLKEDSGRSLKSTEELVQQEVAKSGRLSQIQAQIETMTLKLDEMNSDLSLRRAEHLRLAEEVHRKEAALESLLGEMNMQDEHEERLGEEHREIDQRIVALEKEKENLGNTIEETQAKAASLQQEASLCEQRITGRGQFLKDVKEAFEEARADLSARKNREVGLTHESGYLNRMLTQITDSRSRLERELSDAEAKMETVTAASEKKRAAREAAHERLQEIGASIEQHRRDIESLEQTKEDIESELKKAEVALNTCQSRLASVRSLTENFEGFKLGVRTIMKAKDLEPFQQGKILGLVADIVQVDSKYEQAVEAVLADKLQYVIVDSLEDGKKAVDYLKKKSRGRSSFVSIRDLNGNGKPSANPPHFPLLKDFVSVPKGFEPLVHGLLGETEVVEDLESALSAWNANGKDRCFVTPDGDMVDDRGVISGGKLSSRSSLGLLGRKREIRDLEKQSETLEQRVDELNGKLQDISSRIQSEKETLEQLTDKKWECQDEVNDFDQALFRLGQELDQQEKLAEKIRGDLHRNGTEEGSHRRELERVQKELQQCQDLKQQAEAYFQEKEKEMKESEEEFDQLRDQLARLRSDTRILEEERRSLSREIERIDEYVDESRQRQERISEDIKTGREKRAQCQQKREEIKEQLEVQYERLGVAEEDLNQADRKRQEFQDQIKEEETRSRHLREEIDALKEKINTAKMEHSEIHYKIKNLEELVRDKFNLQLSDVYEQRLEDTFSASEVEEQLERQKVLRQRLGEVNLTAIKEHEALKERHEFIKGQREDLIRSIEDLRLAIRKINQTSVEKFQETFDAVDQKLKTIFPILFNGGTAGLRLMDESKPLESGVLVEVQPPGKKLSHMGLLSGGEKALVAMALLFAIYMIKPSPFCLLDEVDAPLDEANIDRFNNLVNEIKKSSQIIMVTHNRRTMEIVDRLYGVTMQTAGVSKTVAVDLEDVSSQELTAPQPASS